MKAVGKAGGLALLYFEAVTTLALIIGLIVVNVVKTWRLDDHVGGALLMPVKRDFADDGAAGHGPQAQHAAIGQGELHPPRPSATKNTSSASSPALIRMSSGSSDKSVMAAMKSRMRGCGPIAAVR